MSEQRLDLGEGFRYHPELGGKNFLDAFFENPVSLFTASEFMGKRLKELTERDYEEQAKNNPWWRVKTMTKSGVVRYKGDDGWNTMKVVPDLSPVREMVDRPEELNHDGSFIVSREIANNLEGFEFKRDNFNYHTQTERDTVEKILEDPILGGICADHPELLRGYMEALFRMGGVPERRTDGILRAHLTVSCDSGVSEPTLTFYGMSFSSGLFSHSPFRHKITSLGGLSSLSDYPTILRE